MNVKYIGRHPVYRDTIYGTGLVFEREVTVHPLKPELAKRFLKHGDSFVLVPGDDQPVDVSQRKIEFSNDDFHRDLINQMADVKSIASYVFTNFGGYQLDEGLSLEAARTTAKTLFNRFLSDEGDFTPKGKPLVQVDDPQQGWEHGPVQPSSIGIEWGPAAPNKQVLDLAAAGLSNSEIGKQLGIHHKTVAKILKDQEG